METGLLDIPAPLLTSIDIALAGMLPGPVRLVLWAVAAGVASMGLYWATSPQGKLVRAKQDTAAARRELAAYDGAFEGLWPLMARSLSTSVRHLGLALGPALLGSLPVLILMGWLAGSFAYEMPAPGARVQVAVAAPQAEAAFSWSGETQNVATADGNGAWSVVWPTPEEPVELAEPSGRVLLSLPLMRPVPVIHKHVWWNLFFANPLGTLPEDASTDAIEIGLEKRQYLPFGPSWLRGWEALFIIVVLLSSLAAKFAFRIR